MALDLTPEKALIFRITHRDNLPWLLGNGVHCARSASQDPGFVSIGNRELIGKRREHRLPPPCVGLLGDYVPFYFTPHSPMLYNIHTGYGDVAKVPNDEIVILYTTLHRLIERGVTFVFSDRHASLATAQFSSSLGDLPTWIPWTQLRNRDFKRDVERPDKIERYQAEALVHGCVPVQALLGIVCSSEPTAIAVRERIAERRLEIRVLVSPELYFT